MPVLSPPKARFPIGLSDYPTVRRGGYTYVDKTKFVADILADGAIVTLFPRPRRFGKTLNMSMLRAFLERGGTDNTDLFEDTGIWTAEGGRYREEFQRYPVIWLTFKEVKAHSWEDAWVRIRRLLIDEAVRLRKTGAVPDAPHLARFTDDKGTSAEFSDFLRAMSRESEEATGMRTVILIDEYDAPLHAAWEHGYWKQAIEFFRSFLSDGLKDNTHLYRGVLTGILKVAKENIFSGLNNVQTYSILSPAYATAFGFTDDEVDDLAALTSVSHLRDELRHWYDGHRFGGTRPRTLYNPWSILSFLSDPEAGFQSFWVGTSSNALIHALLRRHAEAVGPDIATLLQGGTVTHTLEENVTLLEIDRSPEILWGLFTFSGYLTPASARLEDGRWVADLRIPNRETRPVFEDGFALVVRFAGSSATVTQLTDALLKGDAARAQEPLEALLVNAMSHHDFAGSRIEAIYQAFLVGLLVHLEATHRVTSNREAGFGRADVLIAPRSPGPGAVLELKSVGRASPEEALRSAAAQLRDRRYDREVLAGGATVVHQYAVVFDGKRCQVEVVTP